MYTYSEITKYFIIDHKINITLILPCRTTIPYTYIESTNSMIIIVYTMS